MGLALQRPRRCRVPGARRYDQGTERAVTAKAQRVNRDRVCLLARSVRTSHGGRSMSLYSRRDVSGSRYGNSRRRAHGLACLGAGPASRGDYGWSGSRQPVQLPRHSPEHRRGLDLARMSTSALRRTAATAASRPWVSIVGTWNAFNSQINEDDFDTGNKWYESDLYATLGLGFGTDGAGVHLYVCTRARPTSSRMSRSWRSSFQYDD